MSSRSPVLGVCLASRHQRNIGSVDTSVPKRVVADRRRSLLIPAAALLIAHLAHDLDHVRQGRPLETPVILLGAISYLAVLATLMAVYRRSKVAATAAMLVGFGTSIGFVAVHVLPDWGPLADGYPGQGVDGLSWLSVGIEIAVSTWLGMAGLAAMAVARRPHSTFSPD